MERPEKPLKIKIAGDGAQMSRTSNIFVLSFAILEEKTTAETRAIAVVKTKEEYEGLRSALRNVARDVNSLNKVGKISVDGTEIPLEFFLGGDYKFLLLAMGMKSASCDNACIYCFATIVQRCDTRLLPSFFRTTEMKRKLGSHWIGDPGCKHMPIFEIELDHVVVDELHLMLRVTDRLEQGLIMMAISNDEKSNRGIPASQRRQDHIQNLCNTFRSCGITFNVWKNQEGKWGWSSLMGDCKKKLLKRLPEKLDQCLSRDDLHFDKMEKLWKGFRELYDEMNNPEPKEQDIKLFEEKAYEWVKTLHLLQGQPGFKDNVVTPYIHMMEGHVSTIMSNHGNLKMFTGQAVEKKNDDMRKFFFRRINRWDACKSLLMVEKRQEDLRSFQRQKRPYEKKDEEFWNGGGKSSVAAKIVRLSMAPPPQSGNSPLDREEQLMAMTEEELKSIFEKLTGKPIKRRLLRTTIIRKILITESARPQ